MITLDLSTIDVDTLDTYHINDTWESNDNLRYLRSLTSYTDFFVRPDFTSVLSPAEMLEFASDIDAPLSRRTRESLLILRDEEVIEEEDWDDAAYDYDEEIFDFLLTVEGDSLVNDNDTYDVWRINSTGTDQINALAARLLVYGSNYCLHYIEDEYENEIDVYLARTGVGGDFSWDRAFAFILLGYLPPAVTDLPAEAGRGNAKDRLIVEALTRSNAITISDAQHRIYRTVNTLK